MKEKPSLYAALICFGAAFIFIIIIKHWPVYYLVGAYAVFALVFAVIHRDGLIAQIGVNMLAGGRTERAAELFDRAIARGTKNPGIYLHRASILLRGGDGQAALLHLQKALMLSPALLFEKSIYLTMGSCYWVLGNVDKAIEVLEGMSDRYEYVNCQVLTSLGYMYLLKKDYARALELTNKALEDTPDSAAAWDNLGQIRYADDELDEAAAAFTKAVELKDDLPDSHYYLGLIAEANNDRERARACFEKACRCGISALNTVTKEQIEEKLGAYRTYSAD